MLDFVIEQAIRAGRLSPTDENGEERDMTVEVDFPPLVVRDLPTLINSVAQLIQAQSLAGREYVAPNRLATYILQAFGENDVEKALEELDDQVEYTQQAPQFLGDDALPDDMAEQVREAMEALREALA